SWDTKVPPQSSVVVDADHDLREKSQHPKWKDKSLPNAGYTEYDVWLFTTDGQLFFEQTVPAFGPPPPPREKSPETKKAPDPKVVETRPAPETKPASPAEAEADKELKLAKSYLERNRIQDAKDKLIQIMKKYPDTDTAKAARKMLRDLM